jgi:hypothetical protein
MTLRDDLFYALWRIGQGTGKKVVSPPICVESGGRGVGVRVRLPGGIISLGESVEQGGE